MLSDSVRANAREGDIGGPLREIANAHPDTIIGSYPFMDDDKKPNTNLVVRSRDPEKLNAAMAAVKEMLAELHAATVATSVIRFRSSQSQETEVIDCSGATLVTSAKKPLRRRTRPFRSPGTSFTGIAGR